MLSVHSVICNSKKNKFIKQEEGLLLDIFNKTDFIKKQKVYDFDIVDPENVAGNSI